MFKKRTQEVSVKFDDVKLQLILARINEVCDRLSEAAGSARLAAEQAEKATANLNKALEKSKAVQRQSLSRGRA